MTRGELQDERAIIVVDGFLEAPSCKVLVAYLEEWLPTLAAHSSGPFADRTIEYSAVDSRVIREILDDVRRRALQAVCDRYGVDPLFPEYTNLVRWRRGMLMPVHADNCLLNGKSNGLAWREYSAIVYLNDDREGGCTYFPKKQRVIEPRVGRLVAFPAGLDFQHGVTRITAKSRYTLPMWFTSDPSHREA